MQVLRLQVWRTLPRRAAPAGGSAHSGTSPGGTAGVWTSDPGRRWRTQHWWGAALAQPSPADQKVSCSIMSQNTVLSDAASVYRQHSAAGFTFGLHWPVIMRTLYFIYFAIKDNDPRKGKPLEKMNETDKGTGLVFHLNIFHLTQLWKSYSQTNT